MGYRLGQKLNLKVGDFVSLISPNGIKDQLYDLKNRKSGETHKLSYSELLNFFNSKSI